MGLESCRAASFPQPASILHHISARALRFGESAAARRERRGSGRDERPRRPDILTIYPTLEES